MGRVIDLLEKTLKSMIANSNIILDETFMMGVFDDIVNQLPLFKDYLKHMYQIN